MKEFGAAVEKRCLVFVAFDDEFLAAAETVAFVAEVCCHAADQEIRPPSSDLKNPGEYCRCRGLAMSSGNDDGRVIRNEEFLEDFGLMERYGIFSSRSY